MEHFIPERSSILSVGYVATKPRTRGYCWWQGCVLLQLLNSVLFAFDCDFWFLVFLIGHVCVPVSSKNACTSWKIHNKSVSTSERSKTADIFDVNSRTISTTNLSQARSSIQATSIPDLAIMIFAGGFSKFWWMVQVASWLMQDDFNSSVCW
jgi:hypothetical protein